MHQTTICIINNIPTPYRRALFDEVHRIARSAGNDLVIRYLAKSESVRDWSVETRSFEKIFPVAVQFRNTRTPTSDFIINTGFTTECLRYDHVILFGYNYPTYIIVALIRSILRKNTFLFCESTLSDSRASLWRRVLKALFFRIGFKRYVVPGQRSAAFLLAHGARREQISVARNASPMRPLAPPDLSPSPGTHLRLLFVGRLAPEKRIIQLLRAFSDLNSAHTLTVAGSGPLIEEVKTIAESCSTIRNLGSVESEQLTSVYAGHDVLVLLSEQEPWGMVVNEAINHGLALLLSPDVGCAPDLLNLNGIYLDQISPHHLERALEQLSTNLAAYRANSLALAERTTVRQQASDLLAVLELNPR